MKRALECKNLVIWVGFWTPKGFRAKGFCTLRDFVPLRDFELRDFVPLRDFELRDFELRDFVSKGYCA